MRQSAVVLIVFLSLLGCVDIEPCPFDSWPDDLTTAVFMDSVPTCEEKQIWYDVHSAIIQAWGAEPAPVRVWFVRSRDQMVYLSGEVQVWPESHLGLSDWGHGELPSVYVVLFDSSWSPTTVLCHEMVHVYWGLREHDDEFTARLWELLEVIWAPEPCGNLVPPSSSRVTGKKSQESP